MNTIQYMSSLQPPSSTIALTNHTKPLINMTLPEPIPDEFLPPDLSISNTAAVFAGVGLIAAGLVARQIFRKAPLAAPVPFWAFGTAVVIIVASGILGALIGIARKNKKQEHKMNYSG